MPDIDSPVIPDLHKMLNKIFTVKEVLLAIDNLKNGKAPGEDRILNEMLKAGKITLADSLCKIFNLVFESEKYPYIWSINLLVPVFKGGISDNPDNYGGISISSCVGKLYSSVLYNRLIDAIEKFGLLSNNQIGFLKGYMTTDHSFIINSLANHFTKIMKKDLYCICRLKKGI